MKKNYIMKEYHDKARTQLGDEIKVDIFVGSEREERIVKWQNVGTFEFTDSEYALTFFAAIKYLKKYELGK